MTTINNDIWMESFAEIADFLERAAQKDPTANATTNFDVLTIGATAESKVEAAAAMVRLNGGIVAYTRTSDGTQVQWNRFKLLANNSLTAWFFREVAEIDRDN